ncbi:protein-L-isoaspartate O-methyltransferase family protein [Roseomonas marmotae]|uniref:Protein-L-isoaspartate O-methyltransferase n=1 Tax=Roseomonas marmotae TaxID=2768161 RepID=A0ABS3KDU7_9PROT|nr:protein-L-isoaspartate O-methyltransferase [Roseomonas marmotae]MBO1074511.1 protein-L-isoaspartate O-methyltransferase [Roseomonas marmotae]QTI78240.1 protein-L-isoaspartate O-methyltransferase [Roseomonas marmotae]
MNFADARKWMVDGQVRPNKVTDPRIIEAMLELPRHLFVPQSCVARAHADEDVPLGNGRVLMQPMMLARLVQLADVRAGETALVLGAGTGYGAALLARLGARVTAVEDDADLLKIGRHALAEAGVVAPGSLQLVEAAPASGGPAGPFDVVLLEGEVSVIPTSISDRLAEGGRLVTVYRHPGRAGAAVIGRRIGGAFSVTEAFDCTTAPLPGFSQEPSFVF